MNAHTLFASLLRSLGAVVLAATGLMIAGAPAATAADDDVTWTVRTASNDFGAERSSFNYTVNPGGKVEDALVVTNHGDAALDLGVYAADGFTTDSGQFDLVVAGAESAAVGAWTELDADKIVVNPGQSVEVPFTLTIPKNATTGDYAGGGVTSLTEPSAESGINVDRRLGIKMSLRVGGELAPSLAIEDMRVDWAGGLNPFSGGDATVSYTIHNTGNAVLSAQQAASISGPFGLLSTPAGSIESPPQLLPGETWDVTVPIRNVAATLWVTASATVTPIVVDAAGSTTPLTSVAATATGPAVPWMLLLLLIVVAALVFLALRLRKRNAARQQAREDERVRDAVDRALVGASAE